MPLRPLSVLLGYKLRHGHDFGSGHHKLRIFPKVLVQLWVSLHQRYNFNDSFFPHRFRQRKEAVVDLYDLPGNLDFINKSPGRIGTSV